MSGNRSDASAGRTGGRKGTRPGGRKAKPGAKKDGNDSGSGGEGSNGAKNGNGGKGRGRLFKFFKYSLIGGLVLLLVMCAIFFFAYQKTVIPDPNEAYQAQASYVYYNGGKTKVGQFADQNRESIPLSEMPDVMQHAAIAAEDRTFYTNKGIDPKGILRAAFSNAKGNSTQGASTITQQYVKILYLTQERTLKRKVKEAFLSLKVQQEQSKQQILEGYLNTIYFGRGAYGVQAAARAFFGIDAKKLNAPQSAMLAAVLNSPNYLSPDRNADSRAALLRRYDYVLHSMASMGNLDASEADRLSTKLPAIVKPKTGNQYDGQKGFMLTMVKSELERLGFDEQMIESGGLRVTTTLSRKAMDAAKDAVAEERPDGLKQLHVGTASVDTKTGGLLGFYGGQNYLDSQLNWSVAGGSPGSSFKTFALAAGLKDGFSLKDTFQGNSPYTLPNGDTIKNEGEGTGENLGAKISLLFATQKSVNTAYVDMTEGMDGDGPQKIKDMALKLGIPAGRTTFGRTAGLQAVPSISLGSATISPIDMASAYATIANRGVHNDVHLINKVTRSSDGKVLYKAPKTSKRVLPEDIADDVSYALQETVKSGTGVKAQGLGRPAGGKTGTATNEDGNVSSSWFVGFTPQVASAVMYVRGKGNGALDGYMPSYFGADYPAATWTTLMKTMMDGLDEIDFPPAANVDGDAPTEGHAPYTPPPPKPKKSKKPKPSRTPKPTTAPTPTTQPTQTTPPPCNPPLCTPPGGGTGDGGGDAGAGG